MKSITTHSKQSQKGRTSQAIKVRKIYLISQSDNRSSINLSKTNYQTLNNHKTKTK